MYNSRNILVFLMLLSFQALATQLQPEPRNGFNDCGKVSFSETGNKLILVYILIGLKI